MKTLLLSCLFLIQNVFAQENPAPEAPPKPVEETRAAKREEKHKDKDRARDDKPEPQRVREAMQRIMNSDQLKFSSP